MFIKGADRITYPLNIEVTDASKTAIDYVRKAGGSINLVYRTQLKLKEHLYPEKYPLPLRNPITPAWKIKKLQRLESDRGINVEYPKPKWFI